MASGDYFAGLWQKIVQKLESTAAGQCWLWYGGKSGRGEGQYGIMRVRFPEAQSSVPVRVHRVAYMVKIKSVQLEPHRDVSHLCGHSLCCNPDHLSLEPHAINNGRKHCHATGQCMGHAPFSNCIL